MKVLRNILTIFLMFVFYIYFISIDVLPNQVTLLEGEKYSIRTCLGVKVLATSEASTSSEQKLNVEISLFGKIKLKDISVIKDSEH